MLKSFLFPVILLVCVYLSPSQVVKAENASAESVKTEESGIPYRQDNALTKTSLTKVVFGFIVAIFAAAGSVIILRRYYYGDKSATGNERRIYVKEIRKITPKSTLILVEVDNNTYLMSQCGDNLNIISHQGHGNKISDAERKP